MYVYIYIYMYIYIYILQVGHFSLTENALLDAIFSLGIALKSDSNQAWDLWRFPMGLIGYRSEKRLVVVDPSQIPSAPDEVSIDAKDLRG